MSSSLSVPNVRLHNGHLMPLLAFGTWGGGDSNETVASAVKIALHTGYRHIDCAQMYRNESEIGNEIDTFLKSNSRFNRFDLFITSKVSNTNHAPEHVRKSVKQSIEQLKCSYLDLLLIHWPVSYRFTGYSFENGGIVPFDTKTGKPQYEMIPIIETWRSMEQLVEEGLVRSIGVSNFTVPLLHDLLSQAKIKPTVNQIELHPYFQQDFVLQYCAERNIHVSAYSPLGRPFRTKDSSVIYDKTIQGLAKKYNSEHKFSHEITPASILIVWGMLRNTSVLPKSSTPERIQSNFYSSLDLYHYLISSSDDTHLLNNITPSSMATTCRNTTEKIALPIGENNCKSSKAMIFLNEIAPLEKLCRSVNIRMFGEQEGNFIAGGASLFE